MSEILLGKRHKYKSTDADSLVDRAKQLGFSAHEIGELERLYGNNSDESANAETFSKSLGADPKTWQQS